MQVVVQELLVNYIRVGKGKPVFILHGWGDSSAGWRAFVAELAKHYEVVVPDLPGFGGTEMPREAWSVTNYAVFVRDFLKKIAVRPYAVIGHSNGGAIAVRGIGQGLFQTEKLVLLASAGVRSPHMNQGYRVIAKVGKVVASPLPMRVRNKLRASLYAKAGSDLLVAEHMQETFKRIVRDDVRTDAAYISTPTLLVYGDTDTQTPLVIGQELAAAIEGSTLRVLDGVGHFVHIDASGQVQKLVEDFLRA